MNRQLCDIAWVVLEETLLVTPVAILLARVNVVGRSATRGNMPFAGGFPQYGDIGTCWSDTDHAPTTFSDSLDGSGGIVAQAARDLVKDGRQQGGISDGAAAAESTLDPKVQVDVAPVASRP